MTVTNLENLFKLPEGIQKSQEGQIIKREINIWIGAYVNIATLLKMPF